MLGIVLVEPEIPQNTGNIARTCAVTGCTLHLVGPLGFSIDDKKLKRAGLDYWHLLDVRYYDSLDEFWEKNPNGTYFYATSKGQQRHTDVSYPPNAYLLWQRDQGSAGTVARAASGALHSHPDAGRCALPEPVQQRCRCRI